MPKLATGIDVGTTAVRIVQGYDKKGVFTLTSFTSEARVEADAAEALVSALGGSRAKAGAARLGVTGRAFLEEIPSWTEVVARLLD